MGKAIIFHIKKCSRKTALLKHDPQNDGEYDGKYFLTQRLTALNDTKWSLLVEQRWL